jgi:hypothetical protein
LDGATQLEFLHELLLVDLQGDQIDWHVSQGSFELHQALIYLF